MNTLSVRAAIVGAGLIAAASVARAQAPSTDPPAIARGTTIIGGTAGLSRGTGATGPTQTLINVDPSVLHFFHQRWAFGGALMTDYRRVSPFTSYSVGLIPEIRYYDTPFTATTLPFLRAAFGPGWEHSKVDDGGTYDATLWRGDFGAGITQLVATHVGITGELYYAKSWMHQAGGDGSSTVSSYGLRFGVTAFVF